MIGNNFRTGKKFSHWTTLLLAALIVVSLFLGGFGGAIPFTKAAGTPEGWRDTGLDLPNAPYSLGDYLCIDATQPNVLSYTTEDGTYSFNWVSGQKQKLNNATIMSCNHYNGWMFGEENGQPVRFSVSQPQPQPTRFSSIYQSEDSSLLAYSLSDSKLWFSPDAGSTWLDRNVPFAGRILSLRLAPVDARVLYALSREDGSGEKKLVYAVYRSQDAGQTWAKGYTGEAGGILFQPSAGFEFVPGRNAPVWLVAIRVNNGSAGSSGQTTTLISSDGGVTFRQLAVSSIAGSLNSLFYSNDGLVIQYLSGFRISYDGGVTSQPLVQPYDFNTYYGSTARVNSTPAAPANFFSSDNGDGKLYYSPDNGRSWRVLAGRTETLTSTPYAPLTLFGTSGKRLYVLDLKDGDKTETLPVRATNAPGSTFFEATRHNLRGVFKAYWEKYGGLAQFGYPKTEEFREFNPADGKIYAVQYFERNRFEYHPENAGTKYEVLLGLLGNQLTAERRANGEGAFNHFGNANYAGGTYFPETGHNLRNSFKDYWEANGGLSLYGYPTSEEFYEMNPDDGKTYVVQYFERNRFEYHPENKGTKYEVLLGLLGNSLLKQKGWL